MQMEEQAMVMNGGGSSGGGFSKRGIKRHASDSNLSDFERFEKRLRMLSLRASAQGPISNTQHLYTPISNTLSPRQPLKSGFTNTPTNPETQDDFMNVDDTSNRVFIHDLDAELASSDDEDERLIFLPDIEKKLSKIPHQVLTGSRNSENESQELVLYDIPSSLTVDEGHDSVRKAILESRQRAREMAVEEARHTEMQRQYDHSDYPREIETAHGYNAGYAPQQEDEVDPDAMDIG